MLQKLLQFATSLLVSSTLYVVGGDSPSKSLTYIEILPTSSTSCTSLFFRGENRSSCSLLGDGVGEGVTGNCPRALSGGSVKDGRGGDEFIAVHYHLSRFSARPSDSRRLCFSLVS
jgi:hypothetical protein